MKALRLLGGSAPLKELAAAAHLPASKAHRYLRALIASGFVEQIPASGHYRLGTESLLLGLASLAAIDVIPLAAPHAGALSTELNQTVLLAVWAEHGATVVHVEQPLRHITVVTRLGAVLPLLSSATGLVFAAHLPHHLVETMCAAELRTVRGTLRQRMAALGDRLRDIRANGVASVQGQFFPGIDAVAAPIFTAARQIAAVMTVLGPTTSFGVSADGPAARAVRSAATRVSARLGYSA